MSNTIQIIVAETTTVESFQQDVAEGKVAFYSVRSNGSTRKVQFPVDGTTEREVGEWVLEQRDEGRTMKAIATEMHLSVPSVRRIINAMLLAQEVDEYESEDIAEILATATEDDVDPTTDAEPTHTLTAEGGLAAIGPVQANGQF